MSPSKCPSATRLLVTVCSRSFVGATAPEGSSRLLYSCERDFARGVKIRGSQLYNKRLDPLLCLGYRLALRSWDTGPKDQRGQVDDCVLFALVPLAGTGFDTRILLTCDTAGTVGSIFKTKPSDEKTP